jgi:imidazolonepropionase-like amidohydrolase
MANRLVLFTLLVTLLGTAAQPAAAAAVVFVNGHLVTMTSDGATAGELLVVDERIVEVGARVARPDGALLVDMGGGYLMPGLTEMHAHIPAPTQGSDYRDDVLALFLANGVTTVRGMLGHPDHLQLRADLAAHRVAGPRLITSGPSFNGNSVAGPESARRMVREQVAAGYDFLKIHPGLTRAEYDAMADEADALGIGFAGHVPADVGLAHALARRQRTIDHLDGYLQALVPDLSPGEDDTFFGITLIGRADRARIADVVRRTREAQAAVVPTNTLFENFAAAPRIDELVARPEIAYLPERLLDSYRDALAGAVEGAAASAAYLELRDALLVALRDEGVEILLGSDAPQIFNVPGFSLHRELHSMVAAGLSPREALAAGTLGPARFFGRANEFGALRAGLAADLVLVRADPLADIAAAGAIDGVMYRGRWLGRDERAALLKAVAARARPR